VATYISPEECQVSYNPLLMALLWETLATHEVKLLQTSLHNHFRINPGCAWVNYLRSHDDIGWTFDDDEARELGINPFWHRRFLNDFYTGRFGGTFARGLPFQENLATGDARICGTLASLAGLEEATLQGNAALVDLAIKRILLLHSIILSIGGIPLIYLGDELGTLNDYSYALNPDEAGDSRWVHRSHLNWERAEARNDPSSITGRIYAGLTKLIGLRRSLTGLWGGEIELIDSGNPHIFSFVRNHGGQRLLVAANFHDAPQQMDANRLRVYGSGYHFADLVGGPPRNAAAPLNLAPYEFVWLTPE
jgi:amylosucrase